MDENQGMLTGWQFINGKMVLSEFEIRRQCRHHVFKPPDTGRLVRKKTAAGMTKEDNAKKELFKAVDQEVSLLTTFWL